MLVALELAVSVVAIYTGIAASLHARSGGATGYARYALAYPAVPASRVLYIGISYNV